MSVPERSSVPWEVEGEAPPPSTKPRATSDRLGPALVAFALVAMLVAVAVLLVL